MKVNEAIQILKNNRKLYESDITSKFDELMTAVDIACEVLEKQIPQKPVCENKFDDCVVYSCPACKDEKLILDGDNYCTECGQALDWSD